MAAKRKPRAKRPVAIERVYVADLDLRGDRPESADAGRVGFLARSRNGYPVAVGRVIA